MEGTNVDNQKLYELQKKKKACSDAAPIRIRLNVNNRSATNLELMVALREHFVVADVGRNKTVPSGDLVHYCRMLSAVTILSLQLASPVNKQLQISTIYNKNWM